jgi:hypothetical protein
MSKVRTIIEIDQALLKQIDRLRGDASLPVMLGAIVSLGFQTMKLIAAEHRLAGGAPE